MGLWATLAGLVVEGPGWTMLELFILQSARGDTLVDGHYSKYPYPSVSTELGGVRLMALPHCSGGFMATFNPTSGPLSLNSDMGPLNFAPTRING